MRTTTWTEVQEDIRVRYDLPSITTTTKPNTDQLLRLANQSLQRRDALLAQVFGDDYRTATATLSTVANTATVALPADFLKLKQLVWLRGTDDPVPVRRATPEDQARLSLLSARAWTSELPRYRFQGSSTVVFYPTPNAVYSLGCLYLQTPATITAGADTIQDGPAWTEWLVCDVCVKIATLCEEDPSVHMSERADAERRIKEQAPDRDEYEPAAVRDVSDSGLGDHARRDWLTLNG